MKTNSYTNIRKSVIIHSLHLKDGNINAAMNIQLVYHMCVCVCVRAGVLVQAYLYVPRG